MKIAISGTPGTGKTEVSKELSKILNYTYIDLNELIEKGGLVEGFDSKRKSKIVDTKKLEKLEIPDNSVIDGHLSHFIPVDLVIILRTRPNILKKRLENKGWNSSKVQENVDAEILGICSSEAEDNGQKFVEIDTTDKNPREIAELIKEMIESNKFDTEEIDWLEDYSEMLGD
ncbi:MAG: adenylate kinase family protein [Candidatus Aenigmarchaeota archaeon]|nr:adenylate kinase family protein [Candidatus Aenigmarchaeota archaeon]